MYISKSTLVKIVLVFVVLAGIILAYYFANREEINRVYPIAAPSNTQSGQQDYSEGFPANDTYGVTEEESAPEEDASTQTDEEASVQAVQAIVDYYEKGPGRGHIAGRCELLRETVHLYAEDYHSNDFASLEDIYNDIAQKMGNSDWHAVFVNLTYDNPKINSNPTYHGVIAISGRDNPNQSYTFKGQYILRDND